MTKTAGLYTVHHEVTKSLKKNFFVLAAKSLIL